MLNLLKKYIFGEYFVRCVRTNYSYADLIRMPNKFHAGRFKSFYDVYRYDTEKKNVEWVEKLDGTMKRNGQVRIFKRPEFVKKTPASFRRVDIVKVKRGKYNELANY